MSEPAERFAFCDPIWSALRAQASELAGTEPSLASLAHATILNHERLEDALSYHLARKIGSEELSAMQVREFFDEALGEDGEIGESVRADLSAVFERDPACHSYIQAFSSSKVSMRCSVTGSRIGTGGVSAPRLHISCRAACRSFSAWTFIPRRG